jgi:hypothetical protein
MTDGTRVGTAAGDDLSGKHQRAGCRRLRCGSLKKRCRRRDDAAQQSAHRIGGIMARLRWGLLSTARINRLLIPAIRGGARSELTTVASRALGSYGALLNDLDVDVIYNPLPNGLHVDWTV